MSLSLKQAFVLQIALPTLLFPCLIVLAAGIGIPHWRRMLLVLTPVALALLIFGAVFLRFIINGDQSEWVMYDLQGYATPAITLSGVLSGVGAFLALVLVARSRRWSWFIVLAVAAIFSALAGMVAFTSEWLELFVGSERALSLFRSPLYAIVMNTLAGLTILVQLLYALIGPRTSATTTAMSTSSDDVGI